MTRVLIPGTLLTLISIVYLFGVAPDMSWMGLAGDSPDYVVSSLLFEKAGLGGYPLFITIGWVFQQVFHYGFGWNPYFVLGLVSSISTVVACGYIYATVRLFSTESRLPACLGMIAFASSLLVWSQSVIPEVYTMTAMFMVIGVYYFIKAYKQEKPRLLYVSGLLLGFGLGTHPLIMFAILPCLVYMIRTPLENKPHLIKVLLVSAIGLVGWTQWVIGTENIFYPGLGNDRWFFLFSSAGMIGNLTVVPTQVLEYRLEEFSTLIGLSICIIVPFYVLGIKESFRQDSSFTKLLLVLCLLPAGFYFVSRPPQWITYVVPSVAFLSILGGVCATYFLEKFSFKPSLVVASVCGLGLLGMNLWYYDIGRSVDPSPTTMRQMYRQFDTLPQDAVVYTHTWGHMDVLLNAYYRMRDTNPNYTKLVQVYEPRHAFRDTSESQDIITVPSYSKELWKSRPDRPMRQVTRMYEEDITLLRHLNPERDIYVVYLQDRSTVKFDFISANHYSHSLNDVPQFDKVIGRRVRVQ